MNNTLLLRRMIYKINELLFLFLILISLISCKDDDNIEEVKILLVGKWEGVTVLREDITNNVVSSSQEYNFSLTFWTFEADGTFIAQTLVSGFDTLTIVNGWTLLSENQLIINSDPDDIGTIITLDNKNLVLKLVSEDVLNGVVYRDENTFSFIRQ